MRAVEVADGGIILVGKLEGKLDGVPTLIFREGDARREVPLDEEAFQHVREAVRAMPPGPRTALSATATLLFNPMLDYPLGGPRLMVFVKDPPKDGVVRRGERDFVFTLTEKERATLSAYIEELVA